MMRRRIRQYFSGLYYWLWPLKAEMVEDLPDRLDSGRVYLVGDDAPAWSAALLCPCGCGATIQLSLVPFDKPSWRVAVDGRGRVTLAPSIWRTTGCRAHFFVRRGAIIWA